LLFIDNFLHNILLKGAERKTRDEERRAAKRKLSATGSKGTVDPNVNLDLMIVLCFNVLI
jgi:hypothetical protein